MKCFIKFSAVVSLVMCVTTAFSNTKRVAFIERAGIPKVVSNVSAPLAKEDTVWKILLNPTPPYNCSSMYGFGFEHEEGSGIPGWGGSSAGWVPVVLDISEYAGDTVKIRWAFASDPEYCTEDDSILFGVLIDEIDIAGVFTNNGEDTIGFTRKSAVPIGGDLWCITVDSFAPSPIHAAYCGNANKTYNPNMENAYISPLISLPVADTIIVDFWVRGWVEDPDSFPKCEHFSAHLSPDSGRTWYYFNNPTGDTLAKNYVYTFPEGGSPWGSFSGSYGDTVNISMYAGKDLQFQVRFHSDGDTPHGEGLYIDNFSLYTKGTVVDTFYCEDFETGALGWTSVDLTDIPGVWHPDTFQAYGGSGMSWWMGTPIIGGYLNHWYQVLDSPEIALPTGACSLKFVMNRAVEDPAGAEHPYDGWDGFNVRISVVGAGVEEKHHEVPCWELYRNSPNPMLNKTFIRFSLPKSSEVSLRIYDVSGQLVRILANEPMNAGVNSIMWDARDSDGKLMPGGIYFYELKVGELKKTNKLILLR